MAGRRIGGRARSRDAESVDTESVGAAKTPADLESVARNMCLRLLTARPRSRADLAAALSGKGIPAEVADRVLDRLGDVGLVDDAAFAAMVVRSGHQHRSLGRRAIAAELRKRGIADDTAGEAVAVVDTDAEEGAARGLIERRLRAMTSMDDATCVRRLVAMLARRGYSQGLAYRVVREALRERGSQIELTDPEHVT